MASPCLAGVGQTLAVLLPLALHACSFLAWLCFYSSEYQMSHKPYRSMYHCTSYTCGRVGALFDTVRTEQRSANRKTDNRQRPADNRQQTLDTRQAPDNRQQTTANRQQTTNTRHQTTDKRQQTTDNKQQATDNRYQHFSSLESR